MTNNEIVVRALANTGITALNEMQQAVLDAGTTKDMVLLSPTGSGKTLAFLLPLLQISLHVRAQRQQIRLCQSV